MEPRLSACIIARDEAKVLSRCIDSLQNVCDEVCVLDTGSCDDTIAVARSLGALVASDTGCNEENGLIADFAYARNASLRLARGRWIVQIDADELLLAGHDTLRRIAESEEVDVLGITLRNGEASWMGTRVFRATAVRGFVGRVHERLDYTGRFAATREVIIENRPDKTGKESASARNLRLLRREVRENPDESRAWYYLGNEARKIGDYASAITAYERSISGGRHRFSRFHAPYYVAVCYVLDRRYVDALYAVERAIAQDDRYAEGHCLRGDILRLLGKNAEAVGDYERALACGAPPADAVFPVDPTCYDRYPTQRLAEMGADTGSGVPTV